MYHFTLFVQMPLYCCKVIIIIIYARVKTTSLTVVAKSYVVHPGETFHVSVVAVGQRNGIVSAE